jgi:hypothetical protein
VAVLELVAEHQPGSGEAAIGAIAKPGVRVMLDCCRQIPIGIEAIAGGGIFAKQQPATELRSVGAVVVVQVAVMNGRSGAQLDKEPFGEIGISAEATIDLVDAIR